MDLFVFATACCVVAAVFSQFDVALSLLLLAWLLAIRFRYGYLVRCELETEAELTKTMKFILFGEATLFAIQFVIGLIAAFFVLALMI
jgi:hypothetical protein